MRIGLHASTINPLATPEFLELVGRRAEENGFASLWVGEHVVLFDEYRSAYPYSADGELFLSRESGLLEPLQALAFLAGVTRRIRLGTAVCLLPQRNPVYTAKEVTTADWLSNGRLDFGIGIGWSREEFEAAAVPWERRAARCREYVEVMRRLWEDPVSEFAGEFYRLPPCRHYPKPVQRPHPPLYFGGESEAALARVADFGSGWHGFNLLPEQAAERIRRLGQLLEQRGRSLADVDVTVGTYLLPVDRDALARYRDAGVDQVVLLALVESRDAMAAELDRMAAELVGPARSL